MVNVNVITLCNRLYQLTAETKDSFEAMIVDVKELEELYYKIGFILQEEERSES